MAEPPPQRKRVKLDKNKIVKLAPSEVRALNAEAAKLQESVNEAEEREKGQKAIKHIHDTCGD